MPESTNPNTVVYACSGSSDAGELADRIARQLARTGLAQMSCLAGVSGQVRSLVGKAESAEKILVIDGCHLSCASKTLRLAGFNDFQKLTLEELGFRKGHCPVSSEKIAVGVSAALDRLDPPSTLPETMRTGEDERMGQVSLPPT